MRVGSELNSLKDKIKKIFFYRVCGTGMGACACLAKEAGFVVAGADMTFSPPMSTYLESQDIKLYKLNDLTKEQLSEYDLIVVGNSVPRMSEYARFVEECGVPFTSFPSFLGEFILGDREVIGIAGTHGKTTTTYFLTQMLEELGEEPGYLIGGIMNDRAPAKLGKSKYFVIESDEYDSAYFQKISKFRLYNLTHMVLTSLEFDHADIFDSIDDIKDEFTETLTSFRGRVIANDAYPAIWDLKKEFDLAAKWSMYGSTSPVGPQNIQETPDSTSFTLTLNSIPTDFQTNINGEHNILNITSCILMLQEFGFQIKDIQKATSNLSLVKRRQEIRGHYKKAVVIDDFAHHPKAITLTTQAIKAKFPRKRIVTVFEPISATARSQIFQQEFEDSLVHSDVVILAQNNLTTTVHDKKNLDCKLITNNLIAKSKEAYCVEKLSELENLIDKICDNECVLLVLSNRTCLGLWESDFVKKLT